MVDKMSLFCYTTHARPIPASKAGGRPCPNRIARTHTFEAYTHPSQGYLWLPLRQLVRTISNVSDRGRHSTRKLRANAGSPERNRTYTHKYLGGRQNRLAVAGPRIHNCIAHVLRMATSLRKGSSRPPHDKTI